LTLQNAGVNLQGLRMIGGVICPPAQIERNNSFVFIFQHGGRSGAS
jgi:hypothetical protein